MASGAGAGASRPLWRVTVSLKNEQMPDIAADAKAIAFGKTSKRGYTIVDRIGTSAFCVTRTLQ